MSPRIRPRVLPDRRGVTIIELLVVVAVVALLLILVRPLREGRPVEKRALCHNHLKLIGLALRNYEQAYGALPPARTVDARGRPLHSWRTLILPFMEQVALYNTIDLAKPWDDPANAAALASPVPAYTCLSAGGTPNATAYLAVVSRTSALLPAAPRPLNEITDDQANTILVVEAGPGGGFPWMAPRDADESMVEAFARAKAHNHPGGFQAVFVDGSVRFLKATTPPATLRALMTAAGGEAVPSDAN